MMMVADDVASQDTSDQTPAATPDIRAAAPEAGDIQTYIGARLRKAFDDVARQPVPERFLQLMRDLDRK